jgi:hypothetical protein
LTKITSITIFNSMIIKRKYLTRILSLKLFIYLVLTINYLAIFLKVSNKYQLNEIIFVPNKVKFLLKFPICINETIKYSIET